MQLLLLLFALVFTVNSVILETDDAVVTEVEDLKEDLGEQQPVGRTLLLLQLLKQKLAKLHELKQGQTLPPYTGCICVPFYLCAPNGTIITDGSGIIDFRNNRPRQQCPNAADVCCYIRITNPTLPTTAPIITITEPMTIPTLPTTMPPPPTTARPPTTPPPTVPTTIPTTLPTTMRPTTTTLATTPPNQQYCICIPIFQCALNSGHVVTNAPVGIDPRQQLSSTCNGIFVCCSNIGGQIVVPTTLPPVTLPNPTRPPTTIPTTLPTTTTTRATTTTVAYNLQLNCLCVLLAACSLGYMPMSSIYNIDPKMLVPRQGQSCSGFNSVCCRLGRPDTSVQPYSLVKFEEDNIKNADSPNACRCVPVDDCLENDIVSYDIDGTIDPRFGPCKSPVRVCCKLQSNNLLRNDVNNVDLSASSSALIITDSVDTRANVANCGLRDTTYAAVTNPAPGSSYFAEFPWMVLILVRRAGTNDVLQCGGSLINSRIVLTTAHCVVSCDPGTLIARMGEWNTAIATEPLPTQEIGVQTIIVHPQFYPSALYHDVALLVLNRPVTYAINVRPVCLAAQGQQFAANTICYASGWGSTAFGAQGQYQSVLRKVTLPIVDNASCENRLRGTRLGQFFQLHFSFICAGGQSNMDTCTKDGGGPLVCQESNGRFTQAGIVSWGIGCGSATPGVYASIAQHRQWIDQQVMTLGIST